MNILIPMAGRGTRFRELGYTVPKPLIPVHGLPMIQRVVENMSVAGARYIFVIQEQHIREYQVDKLLSSILRNPTIISNDFVTEGAACTCLLAKEHINNNEPLMIANADQIMDWDSAHFLEFVERNPADGIIFTFYDTSPKNSYARVNSAGVVTEVAEKVVISEHATTGVYWYKSGRDFVEAAESMIAKNLRVNNEFYVCPVYNEMIGKGKKIIIYPIRKHHPIGTPEDLAKYVGNYGTLSS